MGNGCIINKLNQTIIFKDNNDAKAYLQQVQASI